MSHPVTSASLLRLRESAVRPSSAHTALSRLTSTAGGGLLKRTMRANGRSCRSEGAYLRRAERALRQPSAREREPRGETHRSLQMQMIGRLRNRAGSALPFALRLRAGVSWMSLSRLLMKLWSPPPVAPSISSMTTSVGFLLPSALPASSAFLMRFVTVPALRSSLERGVCQGRHGSMGWAGYVGREAQSSRTSR